MNESYFKKKCVKLMREKYGAKVIYIHGSALQEPGLPDTYVSTALPQRMQLWIEFKTGSSVRPSQIKVLHELNKRNPFTAFVVRSGNRDIDLSIRIEYYYEGGTPVYWQYNNNIDLLEIIAAIRCTEGVNGYAANSVKELKSEEKVNKHI